MPNIYEQMQNTKSFIISFTSSPGVLQELRCFLKFIDENGTDDNILSLGKGIIPQMVEGDDEKYYNVVGNSVFEPIFDEMKDGEYKMVPTEFGGAWCYFKRLSKYSVVNNDEDLKNFIMQEKSMQKGGEIK